MKRKEPLLTKDHTDVLQRYNPDLHNSNLQLRFQKFKVQKMVAESKKNYNFTKSLLPNTRNLPTDFMLMGKSAN